MLLILILIQINFCNQDINIDTKVLICNKQINTFNKLKIFTKLEALNLSGSNFTNIDLLKELRELKILDLSKTKVTDINNIKYLKNLLELNIEYTNINNLNPIKSLKKLTYIYLDKISDLNTILKSLDKLLFIQISNNQNINEKIFYHLHNNIYGILSRKQVKIIKFMNKTESFHEGKKSIFHYESLFELFKKEKLNRLIYYYNNPPFYMKSKHIFLELAYLLIKRGININKLDNLSYSPLDCALNRCNLNFKNSLIDNDSQYQEVRIKSNKKLVNLLMQHGALHGLEILKIQEDTKKMINFILSLNLKEKILYLFSPFHKIFL